MCQFKNFKYTLNTYFPKMISVILGGSHHTDEHSSIHFSDQFGLITYFLQ